jgi:1,4-dihydroxy-2-naphthoate octaprenyltransferase
VEDCALVATLGQWVQGARPRTLPAALAPVLVGTTIAWTYLAPALAVDVEIGRSGLLGFGEPAGWFAYGPLTAELDLTSALELNAAIPWSEFVLRALLALVVALALQIGVNYANDYSDGIRGTDELRVGPVRLVGQGLAAPAAVKRAAFACFGIAAVAGLLLVLRTQAWWLLLVGLAAIVAAWFYTGGKRPYGYAGLGELFVFVFFGLVAVVGTAYVLMMQITWLPVTASIGVGALSVAILLVNNLRDIPTDIDAGKRTLAVRLGDHGTRTAYLLAIATPYLVTIAIAVNGRLLALLAFASVPLAIVPVRTIRDGVTGRALVPALSGTGALLLGYAVTLSLGLVLDTLLA